MQKQFAYAGKSKFLTQFPQKVERQKLLKSVAFHLGVIQKNPKDAVLKHSVV